MHVLNPLTKVGELFKDLSHATHREGDLIKMDQNIPIILCKLEKIFPLCFFYSMEHLPVYLANKARLGGSVQYR